MYDTGALIAAESNDQRMWAIHLRALRRGVVPRVPAACIVEAWRGGSTTNLRRLLVGCEIDDLTAERARAAGVLLRDLAHRVSATDATVVEAALRRNSAVVTADRGGVTVLATAARRRIEIIDV